jgi:hypothetical protein
MLSSRFGFGSWAFCGMLDEMGVKRDEGWDNKESFGGGGGCKMGVECNVLYRYIYKRLPTRTTHTYR